MSPSKMTRNDAVQWDLEDPLASHRDTFLLPEGVIYLDGNSLGPLPRRVAKEMQFAVDQQWGQGLIRSWNDAGWFDAAERVGELVAPLIGAKAGEVIVADSMSINLFKLLVGWSRSKTDDTLILCEEGSFPTDLYILDSVAEVLPHVRIKRAHRDQLLEELTSDVSVLFLSHVDYKSSSCWDLAAVTAKAHEVGAWTVWNLAHSAGAMPVDVTQAQVDAAVGCGYKYLNGGPGAPSFVYLAKRHQLGLNQPLKGWFGHAKPFDFAASYEPAEDIKRLQCGTPPILSMTGLEASLKDWQLVNMSQVREKSIRLSEWFRALVQQTCPEGSLKLASPVEPGCRGSHLAFQHPDAYAVMQALIAEGVIGDYRRPDLLRFGFAPLYNRFQDVWDAVEIMATILAEKRYQREEYQRRKAVT
jgi:kynureninase